MKNCTKSCVRDCICQLSFNLSCFCLHFSSLFPPYIHPSRTERRRWRSPLRCSESQERRWMSQSRRWTGRPLCVLQCKAEKEMRVQKNIWEMTINPDETEDCLSFFSPLLGYVLSESATCFRISKPHQNTDTAELQRCPKNIFIIIAYCTCIYLCGKGGVTYSQVSFQWWKQALAELKHKKVSIKPPTTVTCLSVMLKDLLYKLGKWVWPLRNSEVSSVIPNW